MGIKMKQDNDLGSANPEEYTGIEGQEALKAKYDEAAYQTRLEEILRERPDIPRHGGRLSKSGKFRSRRHSKLFNMPGLL